MNDMMGTSDDKTQSFVLRVWEEDPGQRRGTIRHVQSRAQRGFTRLSQAMEFVEHNLESLSSSSARDRQPLSIDFLFSRLWPPKTRYHMAAVAAGVLALSAVCLFLLSPSGNTTLVGTAADGGNLSDWMIFLAGFLLGITVTSLWLHSNK